MFNEINHKFHTIEESVIQFINDDFKENLVLKNNEKYSYETDPDFISYNKQKNVYVLNTIDEPELKNFYIELRNSSTNKLIIKSDSMTTHQYSQKIINKKDGEYQIIIPFIHKKEESLVKVEHLSPKYKIIIAISLKNINKQIFQFFVISLFFSLLLFLVAFFLAFILIKKTIQPMKDIMISAKQLNANDLSKRLPIVKSNDEFEDLSKIFNAMFDQIEDSFKKLKNFNSDASHELKTPLTIMIGELEIILKKERTNQEYKQVLLSSYEETKNLKNIVDTLLMLNSLNKIEIKKSFKEEQVSDILLKVYDDYFPIAQEKNILLDIIQLDSITFISNENLLKSLFSNLIENAIKFSSSNSSITISLNKNNDGFNICVIDEGIGIKPKEREAIFDRFYRIDKAHSKNVKGQGLGLAIVKSIIEIHHGEINIKQNLPKGTIFTCTLHHDKLSLSTT